MTTKQTSAVAVVFHADMERVRARGASPFDGEAIWPEEYTPVAIVGTESVETAFEKTNHIDEPWWNNEGVQRLGPETRSTSVGDVVVIGGTAMKVAGAGWEPVTTPAA